GEEDDTSERRLPLLTERELLALVELLSIQHFTEPPPRYTEASLVKELERLGIGRPSTYAPIISTIQDRGYAELSEKKLFPTTLGRLVTRLLIDHFPNIIDYEFTSGLEQQLDDIATGEKQWVPVLREFYTPFESTLAVAHSSMRNVKQDEILADNVDCPRCGEQLLAIKFGRNGEFLACSRICKEKRGAEADFTSDFHRDADGHIVIDPASTPETSDVMCHICGKPMVMKKGRFGQFYGCSNYPECKGTRRIGKDGKPVPLPEPTGVPCPKCQQGELLKRRGKFGRPFYSCGRYPDCDYAVNDLAEVASYQSEAAAPASNGAAEPAPASNGQPKASSSRSGNGTASTKTTTRNGSTSKRTTRTAPAEEPVGAPASNGRSTRRKAGRAGTRKESSD
ncbi:MAG: DNA topoisomerase I, partial [Chloroflexaceae bacterium]|nr:DNA topoisomerase I [Chloroflexaceae bacterium]